MADGTDTANKAARVKTITVGCRYPDDRVHLLDAITKRRGDGDRSDTIRHALDSLIEHYFPGATRTTEEAEAFAIADEIGRARRKGG